MNASSRIVRVAVSVSLAVALVPLPIGARTPLAMAASTPYSAILAFPDPPHSTTAPSGVAISPLTGNIFVTDFSDNMIRAYAPDGTRLAQWGGFGSDNGKFSAQEPVSLAVAIGPTDGRVYVADTGNNRVQVFSPDGTFLRTFGTFGTGNGRMNAPGGIAVGGPDNAVFVSDTGNARIQKFTTSGAYVRQWGSYGDLESQFWTPSGLAVDAAGSVYVLDTNKNCVKKFSGATGAWLTQWGGSTLYPPVDRYANAKGLTISMSGDKLIVANTGKQQIEICDLAGAQLAVYGTAPASALPGRFNGPSGAAMAADGTLYATDTGNKRIQRADPAGLWTTLAPWVTASSDAGMLSGALGVSASSTGTVYVADTANSRVLRYGPEGAYLGALATAGTGDGQVSQPAAVLVAPDGAVYVADTGNNRIQRFGPSGAFEAVIGAGLTNPSGLAFNGAAELLVADTGNATVSRIARFALPAGTLTGTWGSYGSGAGQLKNPTGLAVEGTTLWIADTGNHKVQRIDTSTGVFGTPIGSYGTSSGRFYAPRGVLGDGAGGVLVADTGNDRLQIFTSAGAFDQVVGGPGAVLGRFHAPAALAAAPGGRTLVVERDGCRVQAFVRDTSPPLTMIAGVPGTPTSADVTLTLSATDAGDAGMGTTYYQIANVTSVYSAPIVVTTEGTTTVAYWSVDRAGVTEPQKSAQVVIDRTPPAGTFVAGGGAAYTTSRTVGIVSAVTGAAQMRADYDAVLGSWEPYAATAQVVLPDADGAYAIAMSYRDLVGNVFDAPSRAITLDRSLPLLTGLSSPTHPVGVPTFGAVRLTWDASSDPSGIAGYYYSADRAPTLPDSTVLASSTILPTVNLGEIAPGQWYFHVRAKDVAGNFGPLEDLAFSVLADTQPPHTTISGVPGGPVRSAAVTVTIGATDDLSGVVSRRIVVDGAETEYAAPVRITKEGTTTVEYWSVDRVGNMESHTSTTVVLDRIAPHTTISGVPSGPVRSAAVTVTLDATDAVSGVVSTRIIVDGAETEYAAPVRITKEGVTTVEYWSVDLVGNSESHTSTTVVLDRIAPTGTFRGGPSIVTARSVPVSSAVVGAPSDMRFAVDGVFGDWSPYAETTQVVLPDADGVYSLDAEYRDLAGNVVALAAPASTTLDRTGPVVTGLTSPTHAPGVPTRGSLLATWDVPIDLTGVLSYRSSVDTEPLATMQRDPLTLLTNLFVYTPVADGVRFVHVSAVDLAGNEGPVAEIAVTFDNTAPTGTFRGGPAIVTARSVPVSSAVVGSPLDMRFAVDGVFGDWAPYAETTQVVLPDADGVYSLDAEYRDLAGNVLSLAAPASTTLDRTGPVVTGLTSPTHAPGVPTFGQPRVTWTVPTDLTGVAFYRYSADVDAGTAALSSSSTSTTAELPSLAPGTYYVHVAAVDVVGNQGPAAEVRIDVVGDNIRPQTMIFGVPGGPVRSEAVTLSLVAFDSMSGVATSYVRINGEERVYGPPFEVSAEGVTTIDYWSVDASGNVELPNTATVVLDRTAPTGTFNGGPAIVTARRIPVSSAVVGTPVYMRFAVDGVFSDWAPYAETTQVVLPEADGVYRLDAEYRDLAGNVLKLTAPASTTLDRTGPVVIGLTSPTHAPGVPTRGSLSATWDIPIDLSGVASYRFSVDTQPLATLQRDPLSLFTNSRSYTPVADGIRFVHVSAVDLAGNEGPVSEIAVTFDNTAPHTAIAGVPSGPVASDSAIITLVATDEFGTPVTHVRVNGIERVYSGPFAITAEGSNVVEYWSVDRAGNNEAHTLTTVVLDRTAPQVVGLRSLTHSATHARTGMPVVAWDDSSDLGGIAGYVWSLDRSPASTPEGAVSLIAAPSSLVVPADAEGAWFLHVLAVDSAGNRGPVAHLEMRVARSGFALSRPVVTPKSRSRKNRTFYVRGTMNSGLSNGQVTVRAYQWRRSGGRYKWVLRSSKLAPITATSASSAAYRGTLRLSAGRWKVVVVHPDDGYTPAATSPYSRTFTVR